jgi:hypothetical protein
VDTEDTSRLEWLDELLAAEDRDNERIRTVSRLNQQIELALKSRFSTAIQHYQSRRPNHSQQLSVSSVLEDSTSYKISVRRNNPGGAATVRFPFNEGFIEVSGVPQHTSGKYRITAIERTQPSESLELAFERDGKTIDLDEFVQNFLSYFLFSQQIYSDMYAARSMALRPASGRSK